MYDPATNTFSPAGANAFPRLYHSNALLLPDATVLLAGGNPQRGNYEARMEIYSPAYLFNGADLAERPVIQSLPNLVNYGGTFQVHTQAAADIASVVLVRPGAATHAFDMDQRLVKLSYTVGSGLLNVTAPPHGNIAPPGYYMLFILNAAGVPSVAKFVQLSGTAPPNQAPTATITNPAADVTISAGQAVSFAGTGNDPEGGSISVYAWTFAGGNPASSSAVAPGPVVYSTPGTYAASLIVTDEGGLTSPSATRTITVTAPADFSLSAAPAAPQTVQAGGSATYTVTVTPSGGFSGAVTFAVSGVPSGASPSFNPASVTTSGTTTLTVATTAATPPGTYQITVTGTSGTLARTANVTLTVTAPADFSISAQPASQTVQSGGSAAFTLTVSPSGGFSGAVTFAVSGVPSGASPSFNPASVTTSGTTTLTVATTAATPPGTYQITVTGTGGTLARTANVTLTVTAPADFSIGAAPASQTVQPGGSAPYTFTVTPSGGFSGVVTFGVSGVPSGTSASFNPASVTTSGTTTLTVATTAATPPGTYQITVTGTAGTLARTANVTLVVPGTFSLNVTPASTTISKGGSGKYAVTIPAGAGFSGTVILAVNGLPKFVNGKFTPTTIVGSGTSTLTVSSNRNVGVGTSQRDRYCHERRRHSIHACDAGCPVERGDFRVDFTSKLPSRRWSRGGGNGGGPVRG